MKGALALVLVAGCVRSTITTTPTQLGAAAADLRHEYVATISASEEVPGSPTEHLSTLVKLDQQVTTVHGSVSIRDLLAGCPDGSIVDADAAHRDHPDCRLPRAGEITLARPLRPDSGKIFAALALTGLVTAPVFATCAIACDDPWSHRAKVSLAIEGGVAVGVLVVGAALLIDAWASHQH